MTTFNTRTKAMYAAWEQFGEDARVNKEFRIIRFGTTKFAFEAI